MNTAQQIISYAKGLFYVVGCNRRLSSGDGILILSLKSTPERDLDEFGSPGGMFQMYGFRKHVGPRLESIMDFFLVRDFTPSRLDNMAIFTMG